MFKYYSSPYAEKKPSSAVSKNYLTPAQTTTNTTDTGRLKIYITSEKGLIPITNATISIAFTGDPNNIIEEVRTDSSGSTEEIDLPAPPIEYSLEPGSDQPYSEYTLRVNAPEFDSQVISGVQILPSVTGIQSIGLFPGENTDPYDPLVIGPHTLYGNYPAKIPEQEIKPVSETGEIVLSRVVIPEYIIVHDGTPSDSTAKDYYVPYKGLY